jgi:hypothetical protein
MVTGDAIDADRAAMPQVIGEAQARPWLRQPQPAPPPGWWYPTYRAERARLAVRLVIVGCEACHLFRQCDTALGREGLPF